VLIRYAKYACFEHPIVGINTILRGAVQQVIISVNIIAMKKHQRAARAQFKLILDHIVDGVVVQDEQTDLVYLNPAAAKLLGFNAVEEALEAGVQGILKDFSALFDDNGLPLSVEQLPGRQALRGEVEPVQIVRVQPRDAEPGAWKWAWVKASSICEEGSAKPTYVVTIFQEITQMKRTEQGLKKANQRVVDLLEQVLDASEQC
jgi:PAS domain S-box-containing protein